MLAYIDKGVRRLVGGVSGVGGGGETETVVGGVVDAVVALAKKGIRVSINRVMKT